MSNNITSGQINDMAQKIANLLDSKEETEATRGNGTIEASIWNKFVGEGQPEDKQVGNGDKSKIRTSIAMNNAVSSIASYIKKKGTAAIANALKQLGIDWKPDVEVKAGTVTNDEKDVKNTKSDQQKVFEEVGKVYNQKKDVQVKKAKKKYEEIHKIATSVVDEKTKMTYEQAQNKMDKIKRDTGTNMQVFVKDKGYVHLSDEEMIKLLERICSDPQTDSAANRKNLEEYKQAYSAKKNLEAKYPDLKDYLIWQLRAQGADVMYNVGDE